jgi:insulysin
MKALVSSLLLTAAPLIGSEPPFTVLEDTASLPLLSRDLADRKTAKIRLQNGMEVLLISDPQADLSAATVSVESGSWNDPAEFPGMAHFCEHMLFMGTGKYPDENEFSSLVADHGGMMNAMTMANRTVYMFSSQESGFLPLLDRFAHFFIDPLFKPQNIAREMHAVDQEFAKNIENDHWRSYMILKATGNPEHPNHQFSCGNSKTLSSIPQSALLDWYQKHYSASIMRCAIYSSLPMDTLMEQAASCLGSVPSHNLTAIDAAMPLLSPQQKGQIAYIKPVQTVRNCMLLWELPAELSDDPTQSADLIAYALKRGQKNSLYEKLKEEQLIDSLHIEVADIGGKTHKFFDISIDLTEKGLREVRTVLERVYQALALIRSTGVPSYLFQEKNAIAKLAYQYQSRQDAFSYILHLGETLADEPLSSYPREQLLASKWAPEKIAAVAAFLTPEKCAIFCMASPDLTGRVPDKKELWTGAEYVSYPVSQERISSLSEARPHPQIRIPEPNPFLPARLEITDAPPLSERPTLISKSDLGCAYYSRSPEYQTPEAAIRLHILSSELTSSAKSQVLASLYLDHLTDLLNPSLSAAASAGLSASFSTDRSRIHLKIDGFNEKAPLLLQEILKQMPQTPPTAEQFAIYASRLEKEYANAGKDLAFRQGKDLLDSILNQDKKTKKEKLAALKTIRFDDFLLFHKKLFEKTYIEALFAGNLTLKGAESAWLDVVHAIGLAPFPLGVHPQSKVIRLPESPLSITETTEAQGNAAILVIDEGAYSFQNRASQEILSAALKDAFFNELRTKQKTGYIAISDCLEIEERLFQVFLVQSNSHQPDDLRARFELFLEEFLQDLSDNIPESRFEQIKASSISSLKNRFRNLRDKTSLWDKLAFESRGDFRFIEKRINGLETLSYGAFLAQTEQFLSRKNLKRLAILFEGKIPTPFAYEDTTPSALREIATYEPRPAKADDVALQDE